MIVVVAGFFVAHYLSVRRQRRDEAFKLYQIVREQLGIAINEAVRAWGLPGTAEFAKDAALSLPNRIGRLGQLLALLKQRNPTFDVEHYLIQFRIAATKDIEDTGRLADNDLARLVAAAGAGLEKAIDYEYFRLFG